MGASRDIARIMRRLGAEGATEDEVDATMAVTKRGRVEAMMIGASGDGAGMLALLDDVAGTAGQERAGRLASGAELCSRPFQKQII